jgi:membrane-associated phospholipid phosphatase
LRSFLLVLLLGFLPIHSLAQEAPDDRTSYAKHALGDVTEGWTWRAGGIIGGTGLGSYLLYRWIDPEVDTMDARKLGSGSRVLSDIGLYGPFSAPALFLAAGFFQPKGSPQRESLFMTAEQLAETMAFSAVTAFALKYSVRRSRPNLADDRSFPSAHAAFSFATAGVLFYRYPWYVGVPSLAAASAVSYSRVDLKKHYASDVLAGAGIGLLFATLVDAYHRRFDAPAPPVAPLVGSGNYGLVWSGSF